MRQGTRLRIFLYSYKKWVYVSQPFEKGVKTLYFLLRQMDQVFYFYFADTAISAHPYLWRLYCFTATIFTVLGDLPSFLMVLTS